MNPNGDETSDELGPHDRSAFAFVRRNAVALILDVAMSASMVAAGLGPYEVGDRLGATMQTALWYAQIPLFLLFVGLKNVRLYGDRTRQPWEYASLFGHAYISKNNAMFRVWMFGRLNTLHLAGFTLVILVGIFFATRIGFFVDHWSG